MHELPPWDVITFNFGLHDGGDTNESYTEGLRTIADTLLAAAATVKPHPTRLVYFLTTIPGGSSSVPGEPVSPDDKRVQELNEIARGIMARRSIPVEDLYAAMVACGTLCKDCKPHCPPGGYQYLSDHAIVPVIKKYLGERGVKMSELTLATTLAPLSAAPQSQGWLGTYHAAHGATAGSAAPSAAWDVGRWGTVAIENSATDGGLSLEENIAFNCDNASVNQVYGMLIAPTEGGVFNNTNDTALWAPLPLLKRVNGTLDPASAGPPGPQGLLQGAARWSRLSREGHCAQIAGVVIDDFWTNFRTSRDPPIPPPTPGFCPRCPVAQPHVYGSAFGGMYCCQWPAAHGHCSPPAGTPPKHACCLWPSPDSGCQKLLRCGTNPANATPCGIGGGARMSLQQMKDVQAVLQGKTFDAASGAVDHSSEPTTPHLKVFIVSYNSQMANFEEGSAGAELITNKIVEGVSFWISGPSQDASHGLLGSYVDELRGKLKALGAGEGGDFPLLTGAYLTYSSIGWMTPGPFWSLIEASRKLYDAGAVQGSYIFAGSVLPDMNQTIWDGFAFEDNLGKLYFPFVGEVSVVAVDAETGGRIDGPFSVAVHYPATNGSLVTRKTSGGAAAGAVAFGGSTASPHHVDVRAAGYTDGAASVRCVAGRVTKLVVKLAKKKN